MPESDIEYMLRTVFNYIPAQKRTIYGNRFNDAIVVDADEFWWRETLDGDGYVMVWYDGKTIRTHHTYNYPPDI